jgi:hypothetical protein
MIDGYTLPVFALGGLQLDDFARLCSRCAWRRDDPRRMERASILSLPTGRARAPVRWDPVTFGRPLPRSISLQRSEQNGR